MKRQNVRSSFALALLLALIMPILAACGGTPAAVSPTAGTAPGATAATAPQATTGTAPQATTPPAATAPAPQATAATGGAATGNAKPGILRFAITSDPATIDPQKTSFTTENTFVLMNYQPLMSFNTKMEAIPGAAESYEVSKDGLTYTFKIRANSKYSDGTPLTAKNFEFAWKRLADPLVAGEYQNLPCGIIKGYAEYAVTNCPDASGKTMTSEEAQKLDLEKLRAGVGVKAIDDNTVEFTLLRPTPYFLSMAALWMGAPVREEDAAKGEDWWNDPANYIGNGPLQLKQWDKGSKIVWEANPNYNGPLGPLKIKGIEMAVIKEDQVAFEAYKNGEIDILNITSAFRSAAEADPEMSKQIFKRAPDATFYVGFNNTKPPFDNKKVRQAFAQAIDRDAWVRDVIQGLGLPAQTFVTPGIPGAVEGEVDKWKFDPAAAKKSLADAGFADGKGLPEIVLTYSSSATNKTYNEWLANQFKQNLGIDVKLDPVDPTAYTELTKSVETSPQTFILGWGPDYPDPQNYYSAVFKTGGSSAADIGFSDPAFDKILDQADTELDQNKRFELYRQALDILLDDSPVVFLYHRQRRVLVQPWVKGITEETMTPLDRFSGFYNLKEIDIQP